MSVNISAIQENIAMSYINRGIAYMNKNFNDSFNHF